MFTEFRRFQYKLLVSQVVVSSLLVLCFLAFSYILAISALIGSSIAIFTNSILGYFLFKHLGARHRQKIFKNLLTGSVAKFISTIILLILVFISMPTLNIWVLLFAMIATQVLALFLTIIYPRK